MAKTEKNGKFFAVRDLDPETRKKIKRYAVDLEITMGEALAVLVNVAVEQLAKIGTLDRDKLETLEHFNELLERLGNAQLNEVFGRLLILHDLVAKGDMRSARIMAEGIVEGLRFPRPDDERPGLPAPRIGIEPPNKDS